MKLSSKFYSIVWKIFLFFALQALSIFFVVKSGTVQYYLYFSNLRNIQYSFWNSCTQFRNYWNLKKINREVFIRIYQLQNENLYLKKALEDLRGNEYLKTLNINNSHRLILAKVVKNSINGTHSYLVIDKGFKDGLTPEMGVIMPNGIVGIIMKTGPNYSYVKSFMNIDQQVSTKVASRNVFGTMSYNHLKEGYAQLHDIPQHILIEKGDTVLTSGVSLLYPSGIPLGTVESTSIKNGTHKIVDVKLFMSYRNLEYVIVAKNSESKQIDSLITAE